MRAKSFYLLIALSIGLLFLMRGCYSADYVINGQPVESIWHVSRVIFQVIVMGMLLMVSMISMRIFTRDQNDGSVQMFLSRPVNRREYVLGRIIGTWLISSGFMLLLHLTMVLMVWSHTGDINLGYIGASIVCSVNLLFIVAAVCLFSLFMPDFISALFAIGLLCAGFVSDGGYRLLNSEMIAILIPSISGSSPATWRVFYPKLFMVQAYADALISQNDFVTLGPVHPLINVLAYIVLLISLTVLVFNKKSI
ncbi:ABC transporter permease subunit [Desulfobacula sp.]|uniref:ABC transporter permease n=1 Tax=Desulfobacula sp. TaxID=2593537 RepID=UPI00261A76D8|nr:ABC transporter permease subunit [Desulfobacula sp.]